jgi:hypothetical protein
MIVAPSITFSNFNVSGLAWEDSAQAGAARKTSRKRM